MKTILRNFLSVLRRFKMATLLNVAGLAIYFAAFIVILIQVNYERSFDRCHPTADQCRLELTQAGTFGLILPRAFVESVSSRHPILKQVADLSVQSCCLFFCCEERAEDRLPGVGTNLSSDIAKVFDFPIIKGTAIA